MKSPQILEIVNKHLIGIRIETSLSENSAVALWKQFMPRKKEIRNVAGLELYSVQVYSKDFSMRQFTPSTKFEKWAAVEVESHESIPDSMEALTLPGGLYAVFNHRGPAVTFPVTAAYIFGQWLPQSEYELDNRPHFEVMGEGYLGPNDPSAEEEVWIPIKLA
jgi:AraC family transcriptional regulator